MPHLCNRARIALDFICRRAHIRGMKEAPFVANTFGRDTMVTIAGATRTILAKASAQTKELLSRWLARSVDRQVYKARFENEMYGGMFGHSSKNDDDLPVIR